MTAPTVPQLLLADLTLRDRVTECRNTAQKATLTDHERATLDLAARDLEAVADWLRARATRRRVEAMR